MRRILTLALCALMLAAVAVPAVAENAPVTIENNGRTTVYDTAPERIAVLSYSKAEFVAALGLADKVVAAFPGMYVLEDVSEPYREAVAAMPIIAEGLNKGTPNLETVLDQNPDFVLGTYYNFLPNNCGAPEDYEMVGAHTYADEGTYVTGATLENTYNDIMNLGKIFRVEARAEALVAEMRAGEAAIREKMAGVEPVPVFVYDSGEGTLYSIGGSGLEHQLVTIAGGSNIFADQDAHYFGASVESIVEGNPEAIIVFDYSITAPAEEKIAYLKSLPELSDVDAIRNDRFVVVPINAMFPSIQNIEVTEMLAKGLHPELFE